MTCCKYSVVSVYAALCFLALSVFLLAFIHSFSDSAIKK